MPAGGGGAFGFDLLGRRRDGFVGGAADDLSDVALDAFGLEFGFGVGAGGDRRGGCGAGRSGFGFGFEFGFRDFVAHFLEGVERLSEFDLADGGERLDESSRRGG